MCIRDRYYHVDKYKYATDKLIEAGEGKFCPFCNTKLQYEYYQYAHIGRFKCPNCYYGNNQINVTLTDVNLSTNTFKVDGKEYTTKLNSIYAIYNFAAVITTALAYKIDEETIIKTIENFALNNGRLEKMKVNDSETIVNLSLIHILCIIATIYGNCYAVSPASEIIYEGIDVSKWQGYIEDDEVRRAGIEIVYIKSAQGSTDVYKRQGL